jgi:16S rRNA processing protein RimM
VQIGRTATDASTCSIEHVLFRNPHVHVKLQGVDDRTEAEKFAGQYIFIERRDVARPPKGSWFVDDIVGCRVVTEEDIDVGVVEEVLKPGGSDLWVVRGATASNIVPAVPEFIREVDLKRKRIVIHAIEGLLDQS